MCRMSLTFVLFSHGVKHMEWRKRNGKKRLTWLNRCCNLPPRKRSSKDRQIRTIVFWLLQFLIPSSNRAISSLGESGKWPAVMSLSTIRETRRLYTVKIVERTLWQCHPPWPSFWDTLYDSYSLWRNKFACIWRGNCLFLPQEGESLKDFVNKRISFLSQILHSPDDVRSDNHQVNLFVFSASIPPSWQQSEQWSVHSQSFALTCFLLNHSGSH